MDTQLLYHVIVLLAVTGLCFVAVLVVLIKDYARIPPRNAIVILTAELRKMKDDTGRKDALVTRANEEIQRLKAETEQLKEEQVRLRDELAAKKAKPLLGGSEWLPRPPSLGNITQENSGEIKAMKIENGRLKEEVVRCQEELSRARSQLMPDTKDIEEMLLAKTEVERLRGELQKTAQELQALKLRAISIFGDGSAACLLTNIPDTKGLKIMDFASKIAPHERDALRFRTEDSRLRNVIKEAVPGIAAELTKHITGTLFRNYGLGQNDIKFWALHPGGRKVLDKIQEVMCLPADALNASRTILYNYGNMSSPTVLYVLKEILESTLLHKGDKGLMASFGAGFTGYAGLLSYN
ncbi:MAG: 3-oxoacyl-[acyl-carrier-protein] synthase III C-terminal domain-containing protein [Candidatus Omnitrophica bacterium]|nr:3-oxoacyl-[acyl-carrier-protein] synthase III C-terminal domain-containing protein [Candidatus Omnitrophota bacterium]